MSYTNGLDKPTDYFNTVLYTGTGATHNITGVGFQPDWVWIKNRGITANHHLFDIARGATKYLLTNATNAEATDAQQLQSFDTDGFTVGTNGNVNGSGNNIVAWNWLASNTTASNTDGSITSTVSASTTSGFSIATYTGNGTAGATFGHGLSSAPEMVIIKRRNSTGNWRVGNIYASSNFSEVLNLNLTNAKGLANSIFNSTAPTSTLVTLGNEADVNGNGSTFVSYCFHSVKGYSSFGSYVGNGSTDGTFVYTGFKPAFVIVKLTSSSGENWYMQDATRDPFNPSGRRIKGNGSDAESNNSAFNIDFLSSGMKMRNTNGGHNGSGSTYIYMAFAENPFTTSTGIPTTAR